MLGVVIWTCQRTGQAIVLCSDGRDLAHFDGPGAGNGQERVAAGDLVEMSFYAGVAVRRCASLRLIESGYMPDVADHLRRAGRRKAIAAA